MMTGIFSRVLSFKRKSQTYRKIREVNMLLMLINLNDF